jgi:hypothetical protein
MADMTVPGKASLSCELYPDKADNIRIKRGAAVSLRARI